MSDTLFNDQRHVGERTMMAFARAAGVRDTARFAKCIRSDDAVIRVRADEHQAVRLGATGTPVLIINGDAVQGSPTFLELRRMIRNHLSDPR